ncbi:4121_t:CDS:2, partial [Racocetra persica]
TSEIFHKNNAISKVKISKAINKYTTSSKKAQRESQLYVNINPYGDIISSSSMISANTMIVDLKSIKLNIANKAITLNYLTKNKNKQKHYTSLVRVYDEALISHDRY